MHTVSVDSIFSEAAGFLFEISISAAPHFSH